VVHRHVNEAIGILFRLVDYYMHLIIVLLREIGLSENQSTLMSITIVDMIY